MNGYVYTVDHTHYCDNVGGFPQPQVRLADAASLAVVHAPRPPATSRREPWGYYNWEGTPSPSLVAGIPQWRPAPTPAPNQAGWTVTGNGQYLLVGGEFLGVGGGTSRASSGSR